MERAVGNRPGLVLEGKFVKWVDVAIVDAIRRDSDEPNDSNACLVGDNEVARDYVPYAASRGVGFDPRRPVPTISA